MTNDAINYIQSLIQNGSAYQYDKYVILDWNGMNAMNAHVYPTPAPIQYPILLEKMHSPLDFPLWAPYIHGHPSPWGNGNVTANVAYFQKYLHYHGCK